MQQKFCLTLLLALLGTMAYLPRGSGQRSPYVPMPVNLPGLLPRFGEVENNNAPSGGSSGQQAPSSSGGDDFVMPSSENNLGVRLSEEERPSRPAPSRGGSSGRCPPQQVPCYECVVYISKTGQITKYSVDQGGRRW